MKRRFDLTPKASADLREILLDVAKESLDNAQLCPAISSMLLC